MLEMLRAITQEVNTAPDLSSAMVVAVDRIRDAMDVKVCSLYLRDDTDRYVLRATQGLNRDAIGTVSMTANEGLVGYVAKRGEPINLENAEAHSRYLYFPETGEERYASFLGVPIIHQKNVLGVLAVQQRERRRFDDGEEAFLLTLSAQLSGIIAHAQATGGLEQYTQESTDARFKGMPSVQGITIGTAVVYSPAADLSSVPFQKTDDVDSEIRSFQADSITPLILGANRDEFFARPTASANYWRDYPQVLAGRDRQAGGTWLGVTQSGRFAAITNVREPEVTVLNPLSRGELTRDFLISQQSPADYLDSILDRQDRYAGFNLLVGEFTHTSNSLFYLSNRRHGIEELSNGTYGLSNHLLDSPWPKVSDGKEQLRARLHQAGTDHGLIRQILENPELADDHRLPNTGVDYEKEKALSAMFIALPDYGTRASTVLTINNENILFSEQNYRPSDDGKPALEGEPSFFTFDKKQHKAS